MTQPGASSKLTRERATRAEARAVVRVSMALKAADKALSLWLAADDDGRVAAQQAVQRALAVAVNAKNWSRKLFHITVPFLASLPISEADESPTDDEINNPEMIAAYEAFEREQRARRGEE